MGAQWLRIYDWEQLLVLHWLDSHNWRREIVFTRSEQRGRTESHIGG